VKGNALFKGKRYTEAYQCYEIGLSHEKPNMALHANAAMASIKMKCFVQAVTHCDKVPACCTYLLRAHGNWTRAAVAGALDRRVLPQQQEGCPLRESPAPPRGRLQGGAGEDGQGSCYVVHACDAHLAAPPPQALQQPNKVVADLKAALAIEPSNPEVRLSLSPPGSIQNDSTVPHTCCRCIHWVIIIQIH
jgi:hypothetical protein